MTEVDVIKAGPWVLVFLDILILAMLLALMREEPGRSARRLRAVCIAVLLTTSFTALTLAQLGEAMIGIWISGVTGCCLGLLMVWKASKNKSHV